MRTIISLVCLFWCTVVVAQNMRAEPQLLNASQAIVTDTYSADAITEQIANWQSRTARSPALAAAWFNYYLWTDRDKQMSSKKKSSRLSAVVADAKKHIENTGEYSLMLYLQSGKKDSAELFNALNLVDDKSLVYPYIVQYGIIRQNPSIINTYASRLESDNPLSSALYTYHYNALMSADSNATIYGRGLYDIVPMAVLQYVYNIRKDIRLKYYTDNVKKATNSYLCLSLGREVLSQYKDAAYTGLLVKMSEASGISELQKHIEKDMDLRFLETGDYWSNDVSQLYKNYLPSFILLYRHYKQTGHTETEKLRDYIEKIAVRIHEYQKVKQLLEK